MPQRRSRGRLAFGIGIPLAVAALAGGALFGWRAFERYAACSFGGHDALYATWSPDGRELAFSQRTRSGFHIFRLRIADRRVRQLTRSNCAGEGRPAWSPEGHLIAYPVVNGSSAGLYVMGPDGRGKRRLTSNDADTPTWSPDGRWIAYSSHSHLRSIRPDGRGDRLVPTGSTSVFDPTWSPDGSRIAFVGNGSGLYIVNARGGQPRRVDPDPTDGCPSWSANNEIAYGSGDIDEYHPYETNSWILFPLSTHNGCASWSPDATKLAVATAPIGSQRGPIYLIDSDGGGRTLVYRP
jgi:Tol biopolymer transport system component